MSLSRLFSLSRQHNRLSGNTDRLSTYTVIFSIFLVAIIGCSVRAQQNSGSIRGTITDELGGLILNANVVARSTSGKEITTTTGELGTYVLNGLAPGLYELRVSFPGFNIFVEKEVQVRLGRITTSNLQLSIAVEQQNVTVDDSQLSTDADNNADSRVLKKQDLESLPNDPQALASALQAMAGPGEGGSAAQVSVDGFSNGQIPPKGAIREVRINQNPFSAQNEYPGYGGIEIYTQPGSDQWHGGIGFEFSDESLNSRNPFTTHRSPYQQRSFDLNLSGPILPKRASFSAYISRNASDSNSVINATVLDPISLLPMIFNGSIVTPQRSMYGSFRGDLKIDKKNTLVGSFVHNESSQNMQGVGGFSLASRAYRGKSSDNTLQLTETAVIDEKTINETRLQIIHNNSAQTSATNLPSINVLDSFFGGGAQTGATANQQNRIELQNFTSWQVGNHFLKFGVRVRRVGIESISPANFGGSYTFAGGPGPRLDANNQIVLGPNGQPEQIELSSLERYRRTLLFERLGMGPGQIRSLGGGATQFFIAGGDSEATIHQTDLSLFVQDEWKLKPNLTLSPGLRYENQTNIKSPLNIAPRIAFAWSPVFAKRKSTGQASKTKIGDAPKDPEKAPQTSAAGGASNTVIRGGVGVFYYRISEDLSLQAQRFNGLKQQQFLVTDASILDLFPNVPPISLLSSFSLPQTRRFIASDLTPGTSLRASLSIARQLNRDLRVTAGYTHTNVSHTLRTVNINAPLPGTHNPDVPGGDLRPFGQAAGNILESESNGRSVSNSLNINVNGKFRKLNFWTSYTLAKSSSTDSGTSGSSQNPYDFSQEWGRSSYDFRHFFYVSANCPAPFGLSFNMFLMGNSGAPFNITIGRDVNGDTMFAERPAFATDPNKPGVVQTRLGALDPNPVLGQRIIPRNLGQGPWYLSIGMGAQREFKFGRAITPSSVEGNGVVNVAKGVTQPTAPAKTPIKRPYSLEFAVYAINLLNSTNPGPPVGNMASPYFLNSTGISGQFIGNGGAGGNRQISLSVRLGF